MAAAMVLPVEEHLALLEGVATALPQREGKPRDKIRAVFEGAFCKQPPIEFLEVVEEVCYIVKDDFLQSCHWFTGDAPQGGDPLYALAQSYRGALLLFLHPAR